MRQTWLHVPDASPYPLTNLPFGVFSHADEPGGPRSTCVRLGDHVVDVGELAAQGVLPRESQLASGVSLNPFLATGLETWREVRAELQRLLTDADAAERVEDSVHPLTDVTLHLPFEVGDYVDFYSSEHHAENVGRIFRPDGEPLAPNWKHLPIGYHGRSGTVVVSGTDVVRPCGQRRPPGADAPVYGPSVRLDIEAEVGFVVGVDTELGSPVAAADFRDHVFGVVLVNDWSARDIQAWEYVPLGPFLGKSFATSVSAWVVPLDALEEARVAPPVQDPEPLLYLRDPGGWGLDLALEVSWNGTTVSRPPFSTMYWTPAQQLAHMTVNGASLRTGDLYASGTVSGPERDQRGSFLELSWNGTEPVSLADGSERTFLEDGDTITISATAPGADGSRIGLGEVSGTVRPPAPA
ncbi:MAG: fumarylacetoacetase [Actinomycetota bacterium]|nr:fumarylacetoacetase [Actinomycetota bacterium]